MFTLALVLAALSTAANLFAAAMAALFGEEAMMGLFALAAGLSGIALITGFNEPTLLLLLMPAATLASIGAVAPLALGYARGPTSAAKPAADSGEPSAPHLVAVGEEVTPPVTADAVAKKKGAWDFLPMGIPVAPPMLSSLAALLA